MTGPVADLSSGIHDLAGRASALDAAMKFSAQYLIYGVVLLLALLWLRREGLRSCVAIGAGGGVAVALSAGIGMIWDRSRPFVVDHFTPLVAHAPDASFPSDHLAALGAVCAVAWVVSRWLGITATGLALIVAVARVFAGVHYVSDVAGGFLLGLACGWLAWLVTGRFLTRLDELDVLLKQTRLRPRHDMVAGPSGGGA